MRRLLFLLAVLVSFAGGAWCAGLTPGCGAPGNPARAPRPAALQRAWEAFERDQFEAFDAALAALAEAPPQDAGYAAEARLLPLLRAGDRGAVRAFADAHTAVSAGAAALEHLVATATDAAERTELLSLLRTRYPRTWHGEARTR